MDRNGRRFWLAFAISTVLLTLLSGSWAIATPIGAAPDEPAHLIKAASVVRGQFVGTPSSIGHIVQVPQYVAFTQAQTCFAFDAQETADCSPEVPGDTNALVDGYTTAGLYNPLYYVATGWPSLLFDDSTGIYAMRLVSALIVSAVLGLSFGLVALKRRASLPFIGLSVAVTPMVVFLGGTVNPNALEIAATLTAFVAMLSIVREPSTSHLVLRTVVLLIAAAIAANMRGLSLLWLAVAVLSPLILLDKATLLALLRRRPVQIAIGATAIAVVLALAWLLGSSSLTAALDAVEPVSNAPGVGTPWYLGFIWTLLSTFDYALGAIGTFGWLDTPAPAAVYFTWAAIVGGGAILTIVVLRGRALVLALVLMGAVFLLPPILQAIYITEGGVIWQGRYILPLFVCGIVAMAVLIGDRAVVTTTSVARLAIVVAALLAVAQFLSFATALRRYAVGLGQGWSELLRPEWAPPGGVLLWLVVFAVVAAGAGSAIVIAARRLPAQ